MQCKIWRKLKFRWVGSKMHLENWVSFFNNPSLHLHLKSLPKGRLSGWPFPLYSYVTRTPYLPTLLPYIHSFLFSPLCVNSNGRLYISTAKGRFSSRKDRRVSVCAKAAVLHFHIQTNNSWSFASNLTPHSMVFLLRQCVFSKLKKVCFKRIHCQAAS